jgi:ATP-dependent Clp protease ATP-binding subunit ClpA
MLVCGCTAARCAGYGKGGLLTEAIRRRPHSVVVFDDVERAHPDVVGLLLQVGMRSDAADVNGVGMCWL